MVGLAAYIALTLIGLMVLLGISIWANKTLPQSAQIPMQWGIDGKPTWSAPRLLGLAFTPFLYLVTSFVIGIFLPSSWGPESPAMLAVFAIVAVGFAAGHYFHIWLAQRGGWGKGG